MLWSIVDSARSTTSEVSSATSPPRRAPSVAASSEARPVSSSLRIQKSVLLRVTMMSREAWIEIRCSSIDELCDRMENELRTSHGLSYLNVLYLACSTYAGAANRLVSSSSSPPSSTAHSATHFVLSRVAERQQVHDVLHNKGKKHRTPFMIDDSTDGRGVQELLLTSSSSKNPLDVSHSSVVVVSALRALPEIFSCVVRCRPRVLQLSVLFLTSRRSRASLLLSEAHSGGGSNNHSSMDDAVFRIPREENDFLVEGTQRLRGTAEGATALTEVTHAVIGLLDEAQRSHIQHITMYYYNPVDRTTTPQYLPLFHIAQLAPLTCILCDLVGPSSLEEGRGRPADTTPPPAALLRSSTVSDLSYAASSTGSMEYNLGTNTVLRAVQSRAQRSAQLPSSSSFNATLLASPIPTIQTPLPAHQNTAQSHDSANTTLFHTDHLLRMGALGNEPSSSVWRLNREESDPLSAANTSMSFQNKDTIFSTAAVSSAYNANVVYDAMRESALRFPSSAQRDGASSHQLLTPSSAASRRDGVLGQLQPAAAASAADERRMLVQVVLHVLLTMTHATANGISTPDLVKIVPNVVQQFLRETTQHHGLPLRFPLSVADTELLQKVARSCVAQHQCSIDTSPGPSSHHVHARFQEVNDDEAEYEAGAPEIPPMVDRLPRPPLSGQRVLVLTKPHFDAVKKRFLVFATVAVDIFDTASAALTQSNQPYYTLQPASNPTASPPPVATKTNNDSILFRGSRYGKALMPFRWFLRTATSDTTRDSNELPIETFFALGIARTTVLSYHAPITISFELNLDPMEDFSHIVSQHERILVHRWRSGGVSPVLEENVPYVVGIEVVHHFEGGVEGWDGGHGVVQATQGFVIPTGSGIAPTTREDLYDMLNF